MKPDFN